MNSEEQHINMEIPVAVGKDSLLKFGKTTLASPMVALGFPGLSAIEQTRNDMDTQLKKLDSYCK